MSRTYEMDIAVKLIVLVDVDNHLIARPQTQVSVKTGDQIILRRGQRPVTTSAVATGIQHYLHAQMTDLWEKELPHVKSS